ncbi:hypothetical protein SeMB42_g04130 [Synchytrium endobioticum]|uniref:FAS1 domain-containing protein n=1 Tax=Synchytrium endobioticum TaxID=286115 RepID=A0A507CGA0_9FUNG|nr:hypothetical protein SeLEV6574_g07805 [Synchytrium endobioticum]TPX45010.1 hypothetical protein SeMB42_g04130 [Synchytrium endobioticum]
MTTLAITIMLLFAVMVSWISGQDFNNTSAMTNMDTLIASGNHTIFVSLLNSTGVLQTLNTTGVNGTGYDVWAPTDTAFTSLPPWIQRQASYAGKNQSINLLRALLNYHACLPAQVNLSSFNTTTSQIPTLAAGIPVQLNYNSTINERYVNDATVLNATNTTNGGVFSIDRVLSPLYFFNTSLYNISAPPEYALPKSVPPPNMTIISSYDPSSVGVEYWHYTNALGTFQVYSPAAAFREQGGHVDKSRGILNDFVKSLGL